MVIVSVAFVSVICCFLLVIILVVLAYFCCFTIAGCDYGGSVSGILIDLKAQDGNSFVDIHVHHFIMSSCVTLDHTGFSFQDKMCRGQKVGASFGTRADHVEITVEYRDMVASSWQSASCTHTLFFFEDS